MIEIYLPHHFRHKEELVKEYMRKLVTINQDYIGQEFKVIVETAGRMWVSDSRKDDRIRDAILYTSILNLLARSKEDNYE